MLRYLSKRSLDLAQFIILLSHRIITSFHLQVANPKVAHLTGIEPAFSSPQSQRFIRRSPPTSSSRFRSDCDALESYQIIFSVLRSAA
jgi:hypothetical protein